MRKLILLSILLTPLISTGQIFKNSKNDEYNVFEKVDIEGGFKGGIAKWNEYVRKNFNFARIEKSLPDSITVFSDTAKVQFIIDKNGIISDIRILSNTNPAFKQSCIELYKDSPHWTPANQCGRPVNAYKKETFILQIDKANNKRVILVR
jgi:hypothetical protein